MSRMSRLVWVLVLLCAVCPAWATTEIYVDQASGVNSSTTTGTAEDPFKSITYAMALKDAQNAPDPWIVHIKAGTYDADTSKPSSEREIFPLEMRNNITLIGDDGAESCIISGSFNANSTAPLLHGSSVAVTIEALTFTQMNRTGGTQDGAGCELDTVTGTLRNCVFTNNSASDRGGAVWLSVPAGGTFDFEGCTFQNNSTQYYGIVDLGGAFFGDFTGCVFEDNTGDCINVEVDGNNQNFTGNLTNCTFSRNTLSGLAAALITGNVTGCTFQSNYRGVYASSGMTGNVTHSVFSGNATGYDSDGAAIAIYGPLNGDIAFSTFVNNLAIDYSSEGGAVFVYGDVTGNITQNIFRGNQSDEDGGAIRLGGAITGNITDNVFVNNENTDTTDEYGGAIAMGLLAGVISGNIFQENSSTDGGGAISLFYDGGDATQAKVGEQSFY